MWTVRALAGIALVLLALVASAWAQDGGPPKGDGPKENAAKGEIIPDFHGSVFINTEKFDLGDLRGKVVILQVVNPEDKVCKEHVKDLDALAEKYAEQGLEIVLMTEFNAGPAKKYVEDTGCKYRLVAECKKSRRRFGVKKFPTTFLLDVDGKIVWREYFADRASDLIAVELKRITDRPWVPAKYAEIVALVEARKTADAVAALDEALAVEDEEELDARDRKRLEALRAYVSTFGEKQLEEAQKLLADAKYREARDAFREVATNSAGTPSADTAAKALETMEADKQIQREIAAWDLFDEMFAKARESELSDKRKAIGYLKRVVSRFRKTQAAEKAAYWVERLTDE